MRALLVGFACYLSTETVAINLPPLFVSPVWPTNAILLCALLVTPVRQWWVYALAGFVSSVNHNAHTGAPLFQIVVFLTADAIEVVGAALAVRRFAGGIGAFENLRNLVSYLIVVVVAPVVSSFVAALASSPETHWTLQRSWFLTDTFGYLTLAPAILTWIGSRRPRWSASRARYVEASLLGAGLLLTTGRVFAWPSGIETNIPALMYLPFPFLLWAAVRFDPRAATSSLAFVTLLAMSGALRGQGPFSSSTPADNALSLQLFLITISPSLMFVSVLVEQQKRSQKALRGSEAQYRGIVEDQTELICRFLPDGTYTFVNGALCRAVQRSPEDLVGRRFWDFFPAERHRATTQYLQSITPARPVASREHDVAPAAPGGDVRWQHWTTRGFFDEHGTVTEYQAVGRDITERKRAEDGHRQLESQRQVERVLRASEERFRSLADSAPVLIWMSGLLNEAVYFNKPWLDFTGRSLDDELGSGWIESIHPDDRRACIDACDAAFARRERVEVQFRLRRHDGAYRWILDNGVPYFGADGAFSGYVGSCVDITPRKLAEEELEQAARHKDEFLAMLGHELRNPLAPIGMAVEMMRMLPPTDDSIGWARDLIGRQLRQLTRLVDDLLDVSRITRGKIALLRTPLELNGVVAQAVETSRPLIESRGHRLTLNVPSDPVWIRGDAVRLGQVLSNLLNNAAKYTPDGGRIMLTAERRDSQVVVTVADDGLGLLPEMLGRVFDLFWQLESHGNAHRGLGIGLTLVKRLVELHGGDVEARSAGPGRGSEFIVRLPALEDEAQPATVTTHGPTRPPLLRHRILVVDDNVDAAEALSRILQLQDQEVCVAHDGDAALQMAAAMQPDVVFLDLQLPKVDGLEVARRLRSGWPGRPPLLVATTGFGQEEDRRRTAEAGFDHHLVKPIDLHMLRSLLASVA